jgi:hypothetical protein
VERSVKLGALSKSTAGKSAPSVSILTVMMCSNGFR